MSQNHLKLKKTGRGDCFTPDPSSPRTEETFAPARVMALTRGKPEIILIQSTLHSM